MGYYTTYRCTVNNGPLNEARIKELEASKKDCKKLPILAREIALNAIEKELQELKPCDAENLVEKELGFNPFDGETKWYEHEEDMKEISKKHPHLTFELKGNGEESEDIWIKYFRNGKMQVCNAKISFEPFDENKLE